MKRILLYALLLCIYLGIPHESMAVTRFSVSPHLIEARTSVKKTYVISLKNTSNSQLRFTYTFRPITIQDDQTIFINPTSAYNQLFQSLTIQPENEIIELDAGKEQKLLLTIDPKAVVPGDYPFALVITSIPQELPENKSASALSGAIAVPILFTNSDDVSDIRILSFTTQSFHTSPPVAFSLKLHNTGETFERVQGTMTISTVIGSTVSKLDIPETVLLANTSREIRPGTLSWQPNLLVGIYKAQIRLTNGSETIEKQLFFVGFPLQFTVILIIAGTILSGIYLRVRKYR